MRKIVFSKNLEIFVGILIMLIAMANAQVGSYNSVPKDQVSPILEKLLAEGRSNYERIRTWQGEADFTVDIFYRGAAAERVFEEKTEGEGEVPKSIQKRKAGKIQFAADFEKEYVYENLHRPNPLQYTEVETERDLGTKSPLPWHTVSVITPEHFTQSAPSIYEGASIKRRQAVREESQKGSACIMSGVFDPRECFGAEGIVWETLPRLIQGIEEEGKFTIGEYNLEVKEHVQGGNTDYSIKIPLKSAQTYIFATMVFSGEKGFNIISYEIATQDGKLFQELCWEYKLVDGVYLSSKTGKKNYDYQTGQLSYQEEFVFRNHKLNQAIPPETFEYTNIGLKDGDVFIDKILNKEYRYEAATKKLKPVEK
ncbi:MAG: hypothetical protein JRJ14_08695 [Deltaproteobacteria bacterium]|nr:hypothetical protein [Deltaproteobacteria bacterium]